MCADGTASTLPDRQAAEGQSPHPFAYACRLASLLALSLTPDLRLLGRVCPRPSAYRDRVTGPLASRPQRFFELLWRRDRAPARGCNPPRTHAPGLRFSA